MTPDTLTQAELLALALEATRRSDSGHAMAYLKQAAARADATPEACFLLGSEYAQIGLVEDALAHLHRAVALAPNYAIARFQLGLLHLTNAQPDEALAVWAPLADLGLEHPLAALRAPAHIGKVHTDAYTGPRYTLRLLKQVPALLFLSPHGPYDGGAVPLQL